MPISRNSACRARYFSAPNTSATRAAQKATATIPIVMGNVSDPVESGFVKSLAWPAGNMTGLSGMGGEIVLKQLEMLLAMVPKLSRVAVLVNPANTTSAMRLEIVHADAQKRGLKILRADARTPKEIDAAFSWIRRQNAGALLVPLNSLFNQQKNQIAELASKHRLPCMAGDRMYSEAGVLMSYAASLAGQYRRAATYVDKILKGAKPADVPVEQPTILELVINGKTAKALGLKIPYALQIMVEKVI